MSQPHPQPTATTAAGRVPFLPLLGGLGLLYLPACWQGYGTDNDIYLVLRVGQAWWQGQGYAPSRNQGFPAFEGALGGLSLLGGPVLCNLVTLGMGLLALWALGKLAQRMGLRHIVWGLLLVGLHPLYMRAANSSVDYLWALACYLLALERLSAHRHAPLRGAGLATALLAGLLLGTGVGLRNGTAVLALAALALGPWLGWARLLVAVGLGGLVGMAWYWPPFAAAGHSLAFLEVHNVPAWSAMQRLVRFLYRNVYFWGLAATAVLGVGKLLFARRFLQVPAPWLAWLAAVALGAEALFAWLPFEPEYLLPILPLAGPVVAHAWPHRWTMALLAAIVSYHFVSLNLIEPDRPNAATSGRVRPQFGPGITLQDWHQRQQRDSLWHHKEPQIFE